jgi:hypothetical protein
MATKVIKLVQIMTDDVMGESKLRIGLVTTHPKTRKLVKIVSGQYWGKYGLSNFWHWREVLANGSLSETDESGYGW